MKNKKILLISLSVMTLMFSSLYVNASELKTKEENTTVEETTEVTTEETSTEEATEETTTTEETIEEETTGKNLLNSNELNTEESLDETETEEDNVRKSTIPQKKEETQNFEVCSEVSYGWLNIQSEIKDSNFKKETFLTFEFLNTETEEVITKELSSTNAFENIIKLPIGNYNVRLVSSEYEDNVIFNETVKIEGNEQEYLISINGLKTDNIIQEEEKENVNIFMELLKNNMIFIILLAGCGITLLVRDLKRKKDLY